MSKKHGDEEPEVLVDGVRLPSRLADKLKIEGVCFNVDHESAIVKDKELIKARSDKAEKHLSELTTEVERLKRELAAERGKKSVESQEATRLKAEVAELEKRLETLPEHIEEKLQRQGKCFSCRHTEIDQGHRYDMAMDELLFLPIEVARRTTKMKAGDLPSLVIFAPTEWKPILDGAMKVKLSAEEKLSWATNLGKDMGRKFGLPPMIENKPEEPK